MVHQPAAIIREDIADDYNQASPDLYLLHSGRATLNLSSCTRGENGGRGHSVARAGRIWRGEAADMAVQQLSRRLLNITAGVQSVYRRANR